MGERIIGSNKSAGKFTDGNETAEYGTRSGNTTAAEAEAGRNTTGKSASTPAGTTEEKENIPRLVDVDIPSELSEEEKRERRKIRDRERYQKKKAEKLAGGNSSSAGASVIDGNQLNVILLTVSGIIASRPNMSHWQLSPQEVEQITTPLSKILAKNEKLGNLGEHADAIALMIASATVIVPRVIVTISKAKEEKQKNGNVVKFQPKQPEQKTANKNPDGNTGERITPNVQDNGTGILTAIPVTI